jgi:hypothetical protein
MAKFSRRIPGFRVCAFVISGASMPTRWQQGGIAETEFLARATQEGFQVSRPYGNSCRYDAIPGNGIDCHRVQVKSRSHQYRKGVYHVRAGRSLGYPYRPALPYMESEIHFIAICVCPEDTWYIFPLAALQRRVSLSLYVREGKMQCPYHAFRQHRTSCAGCQSREGPYPSDSK